MKKRIVGLGVVALVALTTAASAVAGGQSTLVSAYGGNSGAVGTVVKVKPAASHVTKAKPVHTATTLPFTGLNLVWIVGVAVICLALGLGLRRLSRGNTA